MDKNEWLMIGVIVMKMYIKYIQIVVRNDNIWEIDIWPTLLYEVES